MKVTPPSSSNRIPPISLFGGAVTQEPTPPPAPGTFHITAVREEVRVSDDQILEIAEFMHPRTQEIADTLPAPLGRWMLRTTWFRRLIDAMTTKGRTVKTSSLRGWTTCAENVSAIARTSR